MVFCIFGIIFCFSFMGYMWVMFICVGMICFILEVLLGNEWGGFGLCW